MFFSIYKYIYIVFCICLLRSRSLVVFLLPFFVSFFFCVLVYLFAVFFKDADDNHTSGVTPPSCLGNIYYLLLLFVVVALF